MTNSNYRNTTPYASDDVTTSLVISLLTSLLSLYAFAPSLVTWGFSLTAAPHQSTECNATVIHPQLRAFARLNNLQMAFQTAKTAIVFPQIFKLIQYATSYLLHEGSSMHIDCVGLGHEAWTVKTTTYSQLARCLPQVVIGLAVHPRSTHLYRQGHFQ